MFVYSYLSRPHCVFKEMLLFSYGDTQGRKRMTRVRDLLRHPLPIAQEGHKVLAVVPQQVIRHLLANEDFCSLDDFTDGQRWVVVVILVVNTVWVISHHVLEQLHAHHCLPAEDGFHTGHNSCRALICRQRGAVTQYMKIHICGSLHFLNIILLTLKIRNKLQIIFYYSWEEY